jgi:hypothetical protein
VGIFWQELATNKNLASLSHPDLHLPKQNIVRNKQRTKMKQFYAKYKYIGINF